MRVVALRMSPGELRIALAAIRLFAGERATAMKHCAPLPAFLVCKGDIRELRFLLPGQYRVLFAASLSIVLGLILSFAKMRNMKNSNIKQ